MLIFSVFVLFIYKLVEIVSTTGSELSVHYFKFGTQPISTDTRWKLSTSFESFPWVTLARQLVYSSNWANIDLWISISKYRFPINDFQRSISEYRFSFREYRFPKIDFRRSISEDRWANIDLWISISKYNIDFSLTISEDQFLNIDFPFANIDFRRSISEERFANVDFRRSISEIDSRISISEYRFRKLCKSKFDFQDSTTYNRFSGIACFSITNQIILPHMALRMHVHFIMCACKEYEYECIPLINIRLQSIPQNVEPRPNKNNTIRQQEQRHYTVKPWFEVSI